MSIDAIPVADVQNRQWRAVYLIARHEKVVAEQLERRSVESFLPLCQTTRYWNKRKTKLDVPLFPSYMFVRITPSERLRVLEVPGVVQIVSFLGALACVPDAEIETLRATLHTRRCEPWPYLSPGRRIRVAAGPLKGVEGIIVRQQSESRIIVSMDFIQRSFSVELEPCDLECLPSEAS